MTNCTSQITMHSTTKVEHFFPKHNGLFSKVSSYTNLFETVLVQTGKPVQL